MSAIEMIKTIRTEFEADLALIKTSASGTRDDVEMYRAQLEQFKTDQDAKLNEFLEKLTAVELRTSRAGMPGGGRGRVARGIGAQILASDEIKTMMTSGAVQSSMIKLKGGIHQSLRWMGARGLIGKAITDMDPAGLIWEFQDMGESAKVDRFYQPSLRSLIPSVRMTEGDSFAFSRRKLFYHLVGVLAAEAASGQADATLTNAEGVKPGSIMFLDPTGTNESAIVDSVNYDTGVVTFTANLGSTHAIGLRVVSNNFLFTPKTKELPKLQVEWDQPKGTIKKLGVSFDIPRECFEDAPRFEDEINQDLPPVLDRQFDNQVFYGNGTDREFLGILIDSDVPDYDWSSGKPGDTREDAIKRAIVLQRLSARRPDWVHCSPTDIGEMELQKDENGRYLDKLIVREGQLEIWRTGVRDEDALATGDFAVASWRFGAKVYDRQSAEMQMSTEHKSNFTEEMITIKMSERLGFANREPNAFVAGKFDNPPV